MTRLNSGAPRTAYNFSAYVADLIRRDQEHAQAGRSRELDEYRVRNEIKIKNEA